MDFYDRISELCREKGTSMAAVARDVGLSNSATTYWKRGSVPKSDTLQKLADYFGVSVDYLLGISDSAWKKIEQQIRETSSPSILSTYPTSELQRTIAAMENLNTEGQEKVAGYAEDLDASGRYIKNHQRGVDKKQA